MIEKYQHLQKLPISAEVKALEEALQTLLSTTKEDNEEIKFLFSRCNKLWRKLQKLDR